MLDGAEMLAHGIEEEDGEKVLALELAHRVDALIKGTEVGDCITDRAVIRELELESFEKEIDLGEGTLLLVLGFELVEHKLCSSQRTCEMSVGIRDVTQYESPKGTVVAMPNVIRVSSNGRIGTGERAIEPRIQALLQSEKMEFVAPLDPVRFTQIEDQVRRPGIG